VTAQQLDEHLVAHLLVGWAVVQQVLGSQVQAPAAVEEVTGVVQPGAQMLLVHLQQGSVACQQASPERQLQQVAPPGQAPPAGVLKPVAEPMLASLSPAPAPLLVALLLLLLQGGQQPGCQVLQLVVVQVQDLVQMLGPVLIQGLV
jgi:hypothetical protein